MSWLVAAVLSAALCVPITVTHAQEGTLAPAAAPRHAVSALRAERAGDPDLADDDRWRLDRCLLGLSYGSPLKLSVAAAGGARRAFASRSVCAYGAAHLGLGGTRASLGSAVTIGRLASAVGVSGGALRTFGSPGGDALRWRNYLGGSLHLWPLLGVHTELGAYSLVTRSGEAGQRLVTWSVGFGY